MRLALSVFATQRNHLLPHQLPRICFISPITNRSCSTTAMTSITVSPASNASRQPEDAHLKSHHNKAKGKGFLNPWPSFEERTSEILKHAFLGRLRGQVAEPPSIAPEDIPPVQKPTFLQSRDTEKLRATWLGHACFYVEFPGGLRVLFDPVFTDRCSPFSFMGPKRFTKVPCEVEDFPFLDIVVISHNHYDHLSYPTLKKIAERWKDVVFFVPLGLKDWFDRGGFRNVTEMDWWEERDVEITPTLAREGDVAHKLTATLSALPAQHMTARTGFDKAETLWAGWSITSGNKKVYFAGDTAYRSVPQLPKSEFDYDPEKYGHLPHCPVFEQIGSLRGPFDLGLIPIGAYAPRWLFSPVHANPYDSVNIFSETKCERALGMHWGTWVLTEERVMEPKEVLTEALRWKGVKEDGLFETIDIGASKEY